VLNLSASRTEIMAVVRYYHWQNVCIV